MGHSHILKALNLLSQECGASGHTFILVIREKSHGEVDLISQNKFFPKFLSLEDYAEGMCEQFQKSFHLNPRRENYYGIPLASKTPISFVCDSN